MFCFFAFYKGSYVKLHANKTRVDLSFARDGKQDANQSGHLRREAIRDAKRCDQTLTTLGGLWVPS